MGRDLTTGIEVSVLAPEGPTIERLASDLRDRGHLVAFPTETVYGLGANALDAAAVERIYTLKKRPHSDPVICHVTDVRSALSLWQCTELEEKAVRLLAGAFWPGPLSLICRAASHVPSAVGGGTPFVSARVPNHAVALAFLKAAGVPVAAPSANVFGRISPSSSSHVVKSFAGAEVLDCQDRLCVIEGGDAMVGIESTVCRVEDVGGDLVLTVLRRGHVGLQEILDATWVLQKANMVVTVIAKESHIDHTKDKCLSPGMALTHYAPSIHTCLLKPSLDEVGTLSEEKAQMLSEAVLIDFFERLSSLRDIAKVYRNYGELSEGLSALESQIFKILHEAEDTALGIQAKSILIYDLRSELRNNEVGVAIYDRLFRWDPVHSTCPSSSFPSGVHLVV